MLDIILFILVVAWGAQTVTSAIGVGKFRRLLRKKGREAAREYRPRAVVIVPFKGREPGLEANIASLLRQEYPDYRVVMVVESEADPACAVIDGAIARHGAQRAERLVAGRAPANVGQKVHNQLVALAHVKAAELGEAVWVFADSDAVPGPAWLGHLVGPLVQQHKTAVTTGYRWLVPEPGLTPMRQFCSSLGSVMNASAACMLGHDWLNQAWGGSMGLRRDTAEAGRLEQHLQGAITDDYVVTRLAKRLGKRVYFVPGCLVASPVDLGVAELVNFAHRQYLITRVYAPGIFAGALALHALYVAGLVAAWTLVARGVALADGGLALLGAAGLTTALVANQVRASLRGRFVRQVFDGATATRLRPALRLDRWATWLWMSVHLLLILRAAVGRTMRWRGVRYRVYAPQHVERLDQPEPPPGRAAVATTQQK